MSLLIKRTIFICIFLLVGLSRAEVAPPNNLSYSIKDQNLFLSWMPVDGADGYYLYYAPYPFVDESTIGSIYIGAETSFSITLWDGAAYYIATSAVKNGIESDFSNIELFFIDPRLSTDVGIWSTDYSGSDVYLGCWYCNLTSSNSVHNSNSYYGSEYGTYSIHYNYGAYGSSYSSTSACDTYASNPPTLQDNNYYYGKLSVNTYLTDSICNTYSISYDSNSCALLNYYCE